MIREDMWTEEEKDFVRESYKTKTTKEISELMNRSHSGVRRIVTELGMRNKNEWTEKDIKILIDFYKTKKSVLEISKKMKRSKASILSKAHSLRLVKQNKSDGSKRFTEKEKSYIIKNYKNESCLEISNKIGRKEESVRGFIKTNIGEDVKKSDFWWTEDELFYLKENYKKTKMKEMIKYLNKSSGAIRRKAQKLKLKRLSRNGKIYKKSLPLSEYQKEEISNSYLLLTASEIARKIGKSLTSVISYCEKNNLQLKRSRKILDNFSDEFLLSSIVEESDKLGRCVTFLELSKIDYLPDVSIYYEKFGSFTNACLLAGVLPISNGIYGKICYSKNEDRCLSVGEKVITDFFIENNIPYKKEVPYRDFVQTKLNYVADWKIYNGTMVEYFGFIKNKSDSKVIKSYLKKTKKKILFCKKNNIDLISIYPSDVNLEKLNEIFKI